MRYVMFFVSLGMFMLVACPQQRLPGLRPQLPEPGGDDSIVKTVRPSPFNQPSALNPGNIRIELESNPSELIKELGKNESGVQRYSIQLETGYINPWVVKAGSVKVQASDIMLASFPDYYPMVTLLDEDTGVMKVQRYSFQMEYNKEDQPIAPMELIIVARNKSYCSNLIAEKRERGSVTTENGIKPDVPEKKADCDTMNGGNIYNFDQKIRLQLLVKNVQSQASAIQDKAKHKFRETIFCSVLKNTVDALFDKAVKKWGSSNELIDLGQNIVKDFAKGSFEYKMALGGYDCSGYKTQQYGKSRKKNDRDGAEKHGPGF